MRPFKIAASLSACLLLTGLVIGFAAVPPAVAGGSSLFLVRPQGDRGELVAYATDTGQARFTLPVGMLAANQADYVAATRSPVGTVLQVFDPAHGKLLHQFRLKGQWELGGIAPNGDWVVLTRVASAAEKQNWAKSGVWQSDLQVVNTASGAVAHTLHLAANFDVDTISADGDSLFLVEHLPAASPNRYVIRLYDLATNTLRPGNLVADAVMAGYAWEGVATPDGQWLLTLYLSTKRNVAFVHTLILMQKYAICIDLPSGSGDMATLRQYTLTLSPSGTQLYAANPALGVVATITLGNWDLTQVARFDPAPAPAVAAAALAGSHGVITADGRTLDFTNGQKIWAYDTQAGKVAAPYRGAQPVVGIGLSGDGQLLYVARADGTVAAINTSSREVMALPKR